jgi:uncharacterized membrane protein YjgN (DUF898 family)
MAADDPLAPPCRRRVILRSARSRSGRHKGTSDLRPFDIALWIILGVAVMAVVWLMANSRRHTSGTADFIATWAATWLLAFLIGGGLMMFGVVVLYFVLGQMAAQVGLALLVLVLIAEPFLVAGILYRRRKAVAH